MWHDKIYYFPPGGPKNMAGMEFIASEFYVKYQDFAKVLQELYETRDQWGSHLVAFSEFRPLASDQIPLSPGKDFPVYSLHFTWHPEDFDAVYQAV